MPALVLKFQYDGKNYAGWQRQLNAMTVQERMESVLHKLFNTRAPLIAAGRTDSGVHARAMVAHIKPGHIHIPADKLVAAINSYLPDDICILKAVITEKDFHARFDAVARKYSYHIILKQDVFLRDYAWHVKFPIDPEKLNPAAQLFIGEHDFTTFSKFNADTNHYRCNIELCEWEKVNQDYYVLHIRADRFVYGMVRSLTGAMIDNARGKNTIKELKEALEAKDRNFNSPLAPAHGLFFEEVSYPANIL